MSSKGQFTLPVEIRQAIGLDKGDKADLFYDKKTKRLYLEKSMTLDELNKLNQAIMKQKNISFKDYQSGDGFKRHVAQKYGELS